MASKYAPGTQAWGRCQRCSQKFLLRDLVFDGYMPGLRVCVDCYDPRHPQEFLQDTADPIALWHPSPEYGPAGATLTVTQGLTDNLLNWTKADPRGGARIANYTVMRATSYDGGVTFQTPVAIYNVVVQYDSFGVLLFDPDHPELDYTPDIPPGTVIVDPYVYDDTNIVPGLTYQYFVAAYISTTRYVPSNLVTAATTLILEYLTSRPYPYVQIESLKANFAMEQSAYANPNDQAKTGFIFESGVVQTLLLTYSNYVPEPLKTGFIFESGSVVTELITYSFYAPEPLKTGFIFEAGAVITELLTYSNYAPEPAKTSFLFIAGSVV